MLGGGGGGGGDQSTSQIFLAYDQLVSLTFHGHVMLPIIT